MESVPSLLPSMRRAIAGASTTMLIASLVAVQACATASGESGRTGDAPSQPHAQAPGQAQSSAPIEIATQPVVERPIVRTLRVTGSLTADEQAEVSAETSGRIVRTPVERGSQVSAGALLVQIAAEQTSAQMEEAQANAARIAAGLALDARMKRPGLAGSTSSACRMSPTRRRS